MAAVVWIALQLADRLIRPVGELVDATRRVTAGELSARVPDTGSDNEIALLGQAFNRMTGRLEEQTRELVDANAALDDRNALMQAVLTGVTGRRHLAGRRTAGAADEPHRHRVLCGGGGDGIHPDRKRVSGARLLRDGRRLLRHPGAARRGGATHDRGQQGA